MKQIWLNGEQCEIGDSDSLSAIMERHGITQKVMAVAINGEIIKQNAWESHVIEEGDKVELLCFVGGG